MLPVLLSALLLTVTLFSGAVLIRDGPLLRHRARGADGQGSQAFAIWGVLLLWPVAFLGFIWLPLWWLALLFVYLGRVEKAVALVVMLLGLWVGPAVRVLQGQRLAEKNPLFRAAISSIESGPDLSSREALEQAARQYPDDADLAYLLGLQYRKGGRYDDAASLYLNLVRSDPHHGIALNNLANLDFARGDLPAAIGRYKQAIEAAPPRPALATHYYNLSLAHLQKFEMQPADEALSQAKRLDGGLIADYDSLWKYDNGSHAVVDLLALNADQAWAKFLGSASGPGRKNVARLAPFDSAAFARDAGNRVMYFLAAFAVVTTVLRRWRRKTFTSEGRVPAPRAKAKL